MTENKICRVCGVELTAGNWYPSCRKGNRCICKECHNKQSSMWYKANPEKAKACGIRYIRKQGHLPFNENKECSAFLGVHIAERVLSHVFKDVTRMPYGNSGYDIICNHNKLIDVKSSCRRKDGAWAFTVRHNTTADYFLCLAFDNREDLTPLHVWLIPGNKLNHLINVGIRPSTIHKWDKYQLDISKILTCCDEMR